MSILSVTRYCKVVTAVSFLIFAAAGLSGTASAATCAADLAIATAAQGEASAIITATASGQKPTTSWAQTQLTTVNKYGPNVPGLSPSGNKNLEAAYRKDLTNLKAALTTLSTAASATAQSAANTAATNLKGIVGADVTRLQGIVSKTPNAVCQ